MAGRRRAETVFRGNRWIEVSETPGGGGQMALKRRLELRPPPPRTKTKGLKGQFTPQKLKTHISLFLSVVLFIHPDCFSVRR